VSTNQKTHFSDYYRVLAETAEDHFFVIDRDDRIEYVNPAGARQHGTVPEQLIVQRILKSSA
jgi:PAS domain S-box-containing protein